MTLSRLFRILRLRVKSVTQQERLDAELERELGFHLELLAEEHAAQGVAAPDARFAARRTLGNPTLLAEESRDRRRVGWLLDFWQDSAYGLRMLRKNPGFTATAAVSLALGIGANTAVLTLMKTLLLDRLDVPSAERVVVMKTHPIDNPKATLNVTVAEFMAWREQNRVFQAVGATLGQQVDLGADADGAPDRLAGQICQPELFQVLGVEPVLGRVFTAEDAANVVVISHSLWQRFGGGADILHRQIRLNGVPTDIIGVMPASFQFPTQEMQFWAPMPVTRYDLAASPRFYNVAARLKPGVSMEEAQRDVSRISTRLYSERRIPAYGVRLLTLRDFWYGWVKPSLLTIEGAVGLVLLVACANVAALLLARASVRRMELAMRAAMGATRGRILRQLLAENIVLALIGGVLGLLLAWAALRSVGVITPPPGVPHLPVVAIDASTLAFMTLLSVATGMLFGASPALAATRANLANSFQDASRAGTTPSRHRLREILVAAQIGLALVSLTGSGLLIKSFLQLAGQELNFDPQGLLTFQFRLPAQRYAKVVGTNDGSPLYEITALPADTLERIHARLRSLPGVESAAGSSFPPLNSLILATTQFTIERRPVPVRQEEGHVLSATYFLITPGFFDTMKAHLVRGRDFAASDTAATPWGAVVNETMARRYWPGENPIGKRILLNGSPEEQARTVIGVVRDMPVRRVNLESDAVIYASYRQQPRHYRNSGNMFGTMTFLLRTSGDPYALLASARSAIAEIEPDLPLGNIQTMAQYSLGRMAEQGAYAVVLGLFALVATLLAAIGVYGLMAYSVAQRTHEIGIRIALGAQARSVLLMIGGRALILIAAGMLLGLGGSFLVTRLIASQLRGVEATDPATFLGVSLLLAAVAMVACLIPARRALRVEPTVALRVE